MKNIFYYNGVSNIMPELVVWMIYLKSSGWSLGQIAVLEGTFTLFSAILEIPSGVIADKVGQKRSIQIGEICCILYLSTFFFPHNHILLFLGFILFALGLTLISGADVSLLYETLPSKGKNYLKYVGRFNAIAIIAMAIGNTIGGVLADVSWTFLFVTAIILKAISLVLISSVKDNKNIDGNVTNISEIENNESGQVLLLFNYFRTNKKIILLILSASLMTAAITTSYQYGPLVFESVHLTTPTISIIFGAISILGAFSAIIPDHITKTISQKTIIIISLISCVLMFILLLLFKNTITVVIIAIVAPNVIFELCNVILETNIQDKALDQIRASIISTVSFGTSLLITFSSLIISVFSKLISVTTIVSILAIFFLAISASFYYTFIKVDNAVK